LDTAGRFIPSTAPWFNHFNVSTFPPLRLASGFREVYRFPPSTQLWSPRNANNHPHLAWRHLRYSGHGLVADGPPLCGASLGRRDHQRSPPRCVTAAEPSGQAGAATAPRHAAHRSASADPACSRARSRRRRSAKGRGPQCPLAPPDTNGAVGDTQYVQFVNSSFAIFNKATGALEIPIANTNTVWSGFGGPCETTNDGDGVIKYDRNANRWLISQLSIESTPFTECVAISQTSDATGAYNRYSFSYGTGFNDYPKFGIWPDAYYVTYNIFANGQSFIGPKACALDRAKMLKGKKATQQCFQLTTAFDSLLPADLDGAKKPPKGSPNYVVNYGSNRLNLWQFHVDWKTPANSTFTGPVVITVPAFTAACSGGTCIPQKGTTQTLDSLADRLMYRFAYRNFGDHESLVVNHSVKVGTSSGIRWYELRSPASSPTLFQSGTFSPDATFRWMGSVAMDKVGDIAVGYSTSSSTAFPSIAYTGRVPGDPLGTLEAEEVVKAGAGSQNGGLSRWGDYTAMSIDPTDDCTFYYTNEYLKTTGSFNWSTQINSFKFPGCS